MKNLFINKIGFDIKTDSGEKYGLKNSKDSTKNYIDF